MRADHRVVGVNGFSSDPNVVRLKAGGKLDHGFGMGGEGFGPLSGVYATDVILVPNGKIVVAGEGIGDTFATRFLGP